MSQNGDFTAKECRAVIKYLFLKGNSAKKIYDDMSLTLGDKCPSYSTVKKWVAAFRTGHWSTEDKERSGRPTQVAVPENVDAIHSMILDDRRISTAKIAETLEISRERVGYIIHEILDMRKLSTKWVPKYLNAEQKHDRMVASQSILDLFRQDPVGFLNSLITMDETWIYIYEREKKEHSKEWRHIGSPRPKKFKSQKSSSKVLASVFWDKDGILLVDYLEKGATTTAKYYIALLDKLKQQLVSKHRGKLSKGILFVQDNAALHKVAITQQKLADLHFEFLKHPAYSPDLAPSDYYLFPNLKKHLEGRKFSSIEDATLAADKWFAAQPKEFFLDGLKKLEQRSHKCVELSGEYVE